MKTNLQEAMEILESIYNEYEEAEARYFELKEKIEWIENNLLKKPESKKSSITTSSESAIPPVDERFKGKSGKDVYKDTIINHFGFDTFKEEDIRRKITEEGFLINGEPIKPVTSRSIIRDLRTENFIETVSRGVNRQVKTEAQREQEALESVSNESEDYTNQTSSKPRTGFFDLESLSKKET